MERSPGTPSYSKDIGPGSVKRVNEEETVQIQPRGNRQDSACCDRGSQSREHSSFR